MATLENLLVTSSDGEDGTSSTENYAVLVDTAYIDSDASGVFVVDSMSTPVGPYNYNETSYYVYNAYFKTSAEEGDTVIGEVSGKNYTAVTTSVNFPQRINNLEYGSLSSADINNWVITTADADDNIANMGSNVNIFAGNGNDYVQNASETNSNVFIDLGAGNDSIGNVMNNVTIIAGLGDDMISSTMSDNIGSNNVSLVAGVGNDSIIIYGSSQDTINYSEGDGNDTIWGYNNTDTIQIDYSGEVTTVTGGENNKDLIINVGNGSMRLVDAADVTPVVVDPSGNIITLGNSGTDTLVPTPSSETYDIVFLIDNTGSMDSVVSAVSSQIDSFITPLSESGIDYRLGLVTFGDIGDSTITSYDFTTDTDIFTNNVSSVLNNLTWGDDLPESGLEALESGLNMNFRDGAKKFFVVITDDTYHNYGESGSGYPSTYLSTENVVNDLKNANVTVHVIGNSVAQTEWDKDIAQATGGKFYNFGKFSFSDIFKSLATGNDPAYTMHLSRWNYSFVNSTASSSVALSSSEDLINSGEVAYYYGRGSQITYNADKNNTVNLFGVSLDQITSAEISAGAVKIGFNDGGNLTMLGQSNSHYVLNGSTWTADQATQTWIQTS